MEIQKKNCCIIEDHASILNTDIQVKLIRTNLCHMNILNKVIPMISFTTDRPGMLVSDGTPRHHSEGHHFSFHLLYSHSCWLWFTLASIATHIYTCTHFVKSCQLLSLYIYCMFICYSDPLPCSKLMIFFYVFGIFGKCMN